MADFDKRLFQIIPDDILLDKLKDKLLQSEYKSFYWHSDYLIQSEYSDIHDPHMCKEKWYLKFKNNRIILESNIITNWEWYTKTTSRLCMSDIMILRLLRGEPVCSIDKSFKCCENRDNMNCLSLNVRTILSDDHQLSEYYNKWISLSGQELNGALPTSLTSLIYGYLTG